jgi:hypothetical protein
LSALLSRSVRELGRTVEEPAGEPLDVSRPGVSE